MILQVVAALGAMPLPKPSAVPWRLTATEEEGHALTRELDSFRGSSHHHRHHHRRHALFRRLLQVGQTAGPGCSPMGCKP
jgi:hypothetical protein